MLIPIWAAFMLPYVVWGLPGRDVDPFLFAGEPPWQAEQYRAAERVRQLDTRDAGADTDLNPLATRDQIINLTETEAARAEILTRYRLYSAQPDEMITLRALQRMNPRAGDFDPKLYQYGGLHIYLVGAALVVGKAAGFLTLTSNVDYYLANPEAFARFYIVARLVTLAFGAFALLAACRISSRSGGRIAGLACFACVALSPVFLSDVLEAKPHLPAACMILWAIVAALDYLRRAQRRDALRLGLFSGTAASLVLTGAAAFALWPGLLYFSRARSRRTWIDLGLALLVAVGVYALTNPYAVGHLLHGSTGMLSNVRNTTAMYSAGVHPHAAVYILRLLFEAVGPGICILGTLATFIQWRFPREVPLAALPAVATLLVFTLLAAGKPAEFARFLVLPGMLLAAIACAAMGKDSRIRTQRALLMLFLCLFSMRTPGYVNSFAADAGRVNESRRLAAEFLRNQLSPQDRVGVIQEPAPYCVPPLDFTRRTVLWLPAVLPASLDARELPEWLVYTADSDDEHPDAWWRAHYELAARFPPAGTRLSRISWANKPVFVLRRPTAATQAAE